jgi:HAD superfamily hydrolase (TIGR01490 family)
MKKVAFFDIDGTLFRSSLVYELLLKLIDEGVYSEDARDEFTDELRRWRDREGEYGAFISAVVSVFMRHIKGVHYGELADVGKIVVAEQSKHVYQYTRDLIHSLKKDGYFLVAISQSPKTIVDEFCRAYGFDKTYGHLYEIGPQDRFTGEMVDAHLLANKANIVARVFEKEEVAKEGSLGVGDTGSDISLLEAVEVPICFNPNKELYEYAKLRGWKVVVERKDVIYTL